MHRFVLPSPLSIHFDLILAKIKRAKCLSRRNREQQRRTKSVGKTKEFREIDKTKLKTNMEHENDANKCYDAYFSVEGGDS